MNAIQFPAFLRYSTIGLLIAAAPSSISAQPFGPGEWGRQFGGAGSDSGFGISADGLGNVFLAGSTDGHAFLRKFDAAGSQLWSRTLSSGVGVALGVSTDVSGDVYVTGGFGQSGSNQDAFLSKYDSSGSELWTRQFGTTADDVSRSVAADLFGNVYVAGRTGDLLGQSSAGDDDAFLRKYDSSGNSLWTIQTGTNLFDFGTGVSVDATGNVYLAGNYGGIYGFVSKFDPAGSQQWSKTLYDASTTRTTRAVAADASGNVYVTGSTSAGGDAMLVKLDTSGSEQWTRTITNPRADDSRGVAVDANGDVYIAGILQQDGPTDFSHDAFVAKYNPSGAMLWSKKWGSTAGFNEGFWGVAPDTLGNVFLGGFSEGDLGGSNAGSSDVLLARIPGPKVYALLIGSRAPAWDNNGVEYPDAIRGDIDTNNVHLALNGWAEVTRYDFDFNNHVGLANVISEAISSIASRITKDDLLIFYYSGHGDGGIELGIDETLAATKNDPPYTDDLLGFVLGSDPRLYDVAKVVLLDSCFSFGVLTPDGLPNESPLDNLPNLALLAAAPEDGFATTDEELGDGSGTWTNMILPFLNPETSIEEWASQMPFVFQDGQTTITGFFKARGYGTVDWEPMSYFSPDFNTRLRLDGTTPQVPEPSALVLFGMCVAIFAPCSRSRHSGGTPR